ncbi:VOC family protein [Compostibacter hankyongensis]|uniref:VOC family protein n=1 Tax=Compostibacter hankyongensis TaxID=1007089 RepID=A0ABP8G969_9BACT
MKKIALNPYLFFDGNCREAMEFYRQVFGGDLYMQTFGEVNDSCPEAMKDSIMHARLASDEVLLMASDSPEEGALGTGRISLALGGTDEKGLRRIFDALSEGGKEGHPLEKQVWGDIYGDVKDKYGIMWMVNITIQK